MFLYKETRSLSSILSIANIIANNAKIGIPIQKIVDKKNRLFFFVIDTKGNPSGSLEYIYNLALIAKEDGYDVAMLHQEEEFVGVGDWLDEKYTKIEHLNITKDNVQVTQFS